MSFIMVPTIFKGPYENGFNDVDPFALAFPFFTGIGDDEGQYAFKPKEANGSFNYYTISSMISYTLKVDGNTMFRQADTINDRPWFLGGVGMCLYYAPPIGWVYISNTFFPGYVPNSYYKDDLYYGDAYYTAASIPNPSSTGAVTFTGAGTLLNSDPVPSVSMSFYWPRWAKTTDGNRPAGIYPAVSGSGAMGTRQLGLPQWEDQFFNSYPRSLEKSTIGKFTYGDMYYDVWQARWIIGTYGAGSGWWEGDEPSAGDDCVFTFTVPAESEVTGDDRNLTYKGSVIGTTKTSVYLSEIGIYR